MVGVSGRRGSASASAAEAVTWHDVECAGYAADLPLWRELAAGAGTVLDVGAGTGRVALDLAGRGHAVTALDSDPALLRALEARARSRGLRVRTAVGDARTFALGGRVDLAIAPMQVLQLVGGAAGRAAALRSVRAHLSPGRLFAAALADPFEGLPSARAGPPLPDMLERDGWVYSSTPVAVREEPDGVAIERVRQAVSPWGQLTRSATTVVLDRVEAAEVESEAASLGFRPLGARQVPPTDAYVGSTVVLLEAV